MRRKLYARRFYPILRSEWGMRKNMAAAVFPQRKIFARRLLSYYDFPFSWEAFLKD
jgi:hypothetical protein